MAIQHHYTVLCARLSIAEDGHPTASGIFYNVEVPPFPPGEVSLGIVVGVMGDEGSEARITLDAPDGSASELMKCVMKAPAELREHQQWGFTMWGTVSGTAFGKPGVYGITVWEGDQKVHTYPFGVLQGTAREEEDGHEQ